MREQPSNDSKAGRARWRARLLWRSPPIHIAVVIGLLVTSIALLLKSAIVHVQGNDIAYLTLFVGLPVAALVGGFAAGVVVVVVGVLVDAVIFQSPMGTLEIADPAAAIRFLLFVPIGIWLAWLISKLGIWRRAAATSAERFESILAALPDFAVLVDPRTRAIEYSNRSVAALRWTPDGLLGRSIDEVIPDLGEYDPGTAEQGLSLALVTPTGDEIPVDLRSAAVVLPTGERRYLLTARDATQRIESEVRLLRLAALERAHARTLETVIGAMEDGVALIGADGSITVANDALALMAGGAVETRADLERAIGSVAEDGDTTVAGSGRQLSIHTHLVNDGPDDFTLLVARDVTEDRRAAAAQDAFIGVLSHELRTPVTTIVGFAELMMRGGQAPGRDAADLLPDLVAEATRLAQLIDDLLVLSRGQSGRMTVDVEPVLVDRVVREAVAAEAQRHPLVRFLIETDGPVPPVDGDQTYLGQVLRNIIGNAAKYGPAPGVVVVRVVARDGAVNVCVLDDGPGFDPDEGPRLFEIYFRSATTAGSRTGSGIGLYVARTLVEAMGGTIWARLRSQGGSEFGFSLPILDVTDLEAEWPTAPTAAS